MSGGSYDYACFKISDAADTLRARHPNQPHVVALARHLNAIAAVMHDIEWADSSDTVWDADLDAKIRGVLAPGAELSAATEAARIAYEALGRALGGV